MSRAWSTPDDVATKVRRRWDDGSLLRAYAHGLEFEVIDVPLAGPRASEIGDDLSAVRIWIDTLDAGRRDDRRYRLTWRAIGGRHFGRNEIPARAVVSTYSQAWALLGVTGQVAAFDRILSAAGTREPVRAWVVAHPRRAIDLSDEMDRIVAAYDWLDDHRGSHRYLREISAPGVDTKFAERHRPVLAAMLGVSGAAVGFLDGLGLRTKPELIRFRPSPTLGLPPQLTELALRTDELARLPIAPRVAFIVENEITYLSVDVPANGIVIWGRGFEVDRAGRLPWLADADVDYWGDIDTHGFVILNRLRAWLPQTRSILMDSATLLAHRDRWGTDPKPARSALRFLTPAEHELYSELVEDVHGPRVRLEQERIDWAWVGESAASHGSGPP